MFNVGNVIHRTVIVAQLVEWSFPEPEIRSLDFAIRKIIYFYPF